MDSSIDITALFIWTQVSTWLLVGCLLIRTVYCAMRSQKETAILSFQYLLNCSVLLMNSFFAMAGGLIVRPPVRATNAESIDAFQQLSNSYFWKFCAFSMAVVVIFFLINLAYQKFVVNRLHYTTLFVIALLQATVLFIASANYAEDILAFA